VLQQSAKELISSGTQGMMDNDPDVALGNDVITDHHSYLTSLSDNHIAIKFKITTVEYHPIT
jgi:hypothetical protein